MTKEELKEHCKKQIEMYKLILELLEQEPCEDTISRQAVIDIVRHECGEWKGLAKEIVKQFNGLPPVQPKPKAGYWILLDECSNSGYYCSECQKKVVKEGWSGTVKKIKYCPNCGARTIESQAESEE